MNRFVKETQKKNETCIAAVFGRTLQARIIKYGRNVKPGLLRKNFRDGNFSGGCASDRVRPGKPDRERGRKP